MTEDAKKTGKTLHDCGMCKGNSAESPVVTPIKIKRRRRVIRLLIAPYFFRKLLSVGKGKYPMADRWRIAILSVWSFIKFKDNAEADGIDAGYSVKSLVETDGDKE